MIYNESLSFHPDEASAQEKEEQAPEADAAKEEPEKKAEEAEPVPK